MNPKFNQENWKSGIFTLFLLSLLTCAHATDMAIQLTRAADGGAVANRKLIITPLDVDSAGGGLAPGDVTVTNTDASGFVIVSNMAAGNYTLEITAPPNRKIYCFTVDGADGLEYITNCTILFPERIYPPGFTTYSRQAIDAKLAGLGTGGSGTNGEANTGANIGTGVGIYAGKSGTALQLRNIATSGGATSATNANTLTISADAAGAAATAGTAATNASILQTNGIGSGTSLSNATIYPSKLFSRVVTSMPGLVGYAGPGHLTNTLADGFTTAGLHDHDNLIWNNTLQLVVDWVENGSNVWVFEPIQNISPPLLYVNSNAPWGIYQSSARLYDVNTNLNQTAPGRFRGGNTSGAIDPNGGISLSTGDGAGDEVDGYSFGYEANQNYHAFRWYTGKFAGQYAWELVQGGGGMTGNPFNVMWGAPYQSLDVLSNGYVGGRGLFTNEFGTNIDLAAGSVTFGNGTQALLQGPDSNFRYVMRDGGNRWSSLFSFGDTFANGGAFKFWSSQPSGTNELFRFARDTNASLVPLTAPSFVGDGSGLTNLSPTSATNNAAASDGWVLSRTGNNLKLIPASGAGTVTSVAISVPSVLSVSGSPITGSGTIAITATVNFETNNGAITSGTMLKSSGGSGATGATAGTDFLTPSGNGSALTSLSAANLTGTLPHGVLPSFALTNNNQGTFTNKTLTNSGPASFGDAVTNFGNVWLKALASAAGKTNVVFIDENGKAITNDYATWVASLGGSAQTAAQNFAASNNIASADQKDVTGLFAELPASFVDGVLFQPRFGTNTTLMGRTMGGGRRDNYTSDGFGITLTNGLTLQLPNALSNVTVVAMLKNYHYWESPAGAMIWSLANTNTKSGIVAAENTAGFTSRWKIQETYKSQQWNANGSLSNLLSPLWGQEYSGDAFGVWSGDPLVVAWQRDQSGNWRMYIDTAQGKIGFINPTLVWPSPTNATDPLSFFTLGFDGATNSNPDMTSLTNVQIASVFVFGDTNFSSVVAGYKAALWAMDTDSAEFWFGDSRLSDASTLVHKPSQYYSRNSKAFIADQSHNGLTAFSFNLIFLANGAMPEITNLPRTKIKNLKITYALGINDVYISAATPAQIFSYWTNGIYQFAAANAKVRFCDIYQAATNATAVTYSLASETNAWTASMMARTNETFPISEYVPLRGALPQALINVNGPFSVDGLHMDGRTNALMQQFVADLIAHPVDRTLTNGPIGP